MTPYARSIAATHTEEPGRAAHLFPPSLNTYDVGWCISSIYSSAVSAVFVTARVSSSLCDTRAPILLDTVTSLSQVSVRLTSDERDSSNEINAPRSTSTGAGCRRHRRGTQNRVQQLHGTANARRPRSICQSLSSSDNNGVTVRDPEEPLYHIVYLFILLKCKGPYGKLTCLKNIQSRLPKKY